MTDLGPILSLWHELESAGTGYVLATIVAIEGSSYRRPGARMLLAQDGRRAGTVSGGCLEAEVARRSWWLTGSGPVVERYSTVEDDGDRPYGSGCGGVVYLLLERAATASAHLAALESAFLARTPIAIATILDGPQIGTRAIAGLPVGSGSASNHDLKTLADRALLESISFEERIAIDGVSTRVWVDHE
ncbi:MAG TPA: XdhC family protein, partial [Dyella sp.]|uniref:XdhC family protein n=1 Tax=Dyella sp. TaxID=1869338 RepID=UPI002D17F8ED